jgi:hypothetical protein
VHKFLCLVHGFIMKLLPFLSFLHGWTKRSLNNNDILSFCSRPLRVQILLRQGVLDTTFCDKKKCQCGGETSLPFSLRKLVQIERMLSRQALTDDCFHWWHLTNIDCIHPSMNCWLDCIHQLSDNISSVIWYLKK